MESPTATPTESPWSQPLALAAVVAAAAAAILLLAGIVYGFATVAANGGGGMTERLRLLGQAASPFVAGVAALACALVVHDRGTGRRGQRYSGPAMAVGATVAFATVLLALNGLIFDFTGGDVPASFKFSSAISRVATVLLAAYAVWLAATAPMPPPPAPPESP
jgi:cytochrome bd-type quinol oxidase subunit 2